MPLQPDRVKGSGKRRDAELYEGFEPEGDTASDIAAVQDALKRGMPLPEALSLYASPKAQEALALRGFTV